MKVFLLVFGSLGVALFIYLWIIPYIEHQIVSIQTWIILRRMSKKYKDDKSLSDKLKEIARITIRMMKQRKLF